ncbi:endonuclease/exonuclease/phosphatase family protein [Streptomyces sp. V4-01]|uniref:Endonuclease/exonuclease/phosphatase family protein n=1 Tax=Actinacidiphila polyblastidii TaxID=3110430 RepID=A0ABU7PD14_9ACTN|nr:endonuclease/exonuclease/phosphatase family protein [Streptomyces sp. V4-01]
MTDIKVPKRPPGTLRMMIWNLLNGGVDRGNEARLIDQLKVVAACAPDLVCLTECAQWHLDKQQLLKYAEQTLGMRSAVLARSHVGDGRNNTTLLYGPDLRLVNYNVRGKGSFHHALIRARFRPREAGDIPSADFLVYGTHLHPYDGDSRLAEARWMTDSGGVFPGLPARAVLLGDLNTADRELEDWSQVPVNLHSRYRIVKNDGDFGGVDQRAVRVLLNSGWKDPHTVLGVPRPPTVGHYYANERVPWRLDYALLSGMQPAAVWTHPFDENFKLSDHLPHFVDVQTPEWS